MWRLTRRVTWIAWAVTTIWAAAVLVGYRLPYLYTQFAFQVRFIVLAPALFSALLYFGLVRRNRKNQSRYGEMLAQIPSRTGRIKTAALLIAGSIYMPLVLAWTSAFLAASAAQLSVEPFAQQFARAYRIEDIDSWGGPLWSRVFELRLRDPITGDPVSLPLRRQLYEANNWKPGEMVCIHGRRSIFGEIADVTSRNLTACLS